MTARMFKPVEDTEEGPAMSEAANFYKEPGEPLDRAAIDLGPYACAR